MDVEVRFESDDPPCGSVHRKGAGDAPEEGSDDRVSFTGWLGLLAALSALVRPAE